MCSLLASSMSLVVAITAQRLHSKVRDFGSGKNFDFGADNVDMGCSQTGQMGTIIAECSSIESSTARGTPPPKRVGASAAGLNRQKEHWESHGDCRCTVNYIPYHNRCNVIQNRVVNKPN
jgi:hypothetical protein